MAKGNEVEDGKVCAILSYLLVGIIWYFADENMKKNNFVKYHVKQGLVLLIFAVAVSIFNTIFGWIPIIGWLAAFMLSISVLLFFVMGLISSINGKKKELPIIGQFAKKFTF